MFQSEMSLNDADPDLCLFKCELCKTDVYFITAEGLTHHSDLLHGNRMHQSNETEKDNSNISNNTAGSELIDSIDAEHIEKTYPNRTESPIEINWPTYDSSLVAEEAPPENVTDEDNSEKCSIAEYRKISLIPKPVCKVCHLKFNSEDGLINHLYQFHHQKQNQSVGTETVLQDRMRSDIEEDYVFFTYD